MLRRIVELVRMKNRARLAWRSQARASGEPPSGWLGRLVARVRAANHARLAHRRARRQLLASLAANDTAMLEALLFLLRTARQERRARADAEDALAERLEAFEARLDAGVRLVTARLQALEAHLPAPGRAESAPVAPPNVAARPPPPGGGTNGDHRRTPARLTLQAREPDERPRAISDPGSGEPRD